MDIVSEIEIPADGIEHTIEWQRGRALAEVYVAKDQTLTEADIQRGQELWADTHCGHCGRPNEGLRVNGYATVGSQFVCHPDKGMDCYGLVTVHGHPMPCDECSTDAEEEMCPNCVTPWKCNGPHVLPDRDSDGGAA